MDAAIEVLEQADWQVHPGTIGQLGGIVGRLSRCRLGDALFFVRENVALDRFHMSSGERQGLKRGSLARRHGQILELLAPPERWDEFAAAVAAADGLGRPVRRNRNFTWAWAERQFAKRDAT
jgi:hypothetical protein